ncbi:MAG: hypothetical protein QN198_01790 [Armatimonadota bacterium]|nr:hypothetical protein [Armatimonadota bacterium]MDR5702318.1 hypothetical protein [Armatimonadota bacterium]MDR7435937.1 hypothetical protein [Armatimonadota bacterium]
MRESIWWTVSIACAVVMVLLLSLHMGIMHLAGLLNVLGLNLGDVRAFSAVVARGKNPVQMVVYVIFLAVALYHGLYGLRGILLEVTQNRRWEVTITGLLFLAGIAAFVYGTYVTVKTFTG